MVLIPGSKGSKEGLIFIFDIRIFRIRPLEITWETIKEKSFLFLEILNPKFEKEILQTLSMVNIFEINFLLSGE